MKSLLPLSATALAIHGGVHRPCRTEARSGPPGSDAGELGRQIGEMMGDNVDDFALALHPALDRDDSGAESSPEKVLKHFVSDDDIGDGGFSRCGRGP